MRRKLNFGWAKSQALVALLAYVSVIGVCVFGIAALAQRDAQSAMHAVDAVASLPIMGDAKGASTTPRVLRSMTPDDVPAPPRVESDPFPHARPAPMLFERLSAEEIDELKKDSIEHVVADDATPWHDAEKQTYKTVCVRLCDGAYFPISFATTRRHFAKDEAQCTSRCGSPARLFTFPNPGGNPEMMRDRLGRSYVALPTAFQFRQGAVAGCSCKAQPWEAASRARHRLFAVEQEIAAGRRVDSTELTELHKSLAADASSLAPSRQQSTTTSDAPTVTAAIDHRGGIAADNDIVPAAATQAPAPAPERMTVRTLAVPRTTAAVRSEPKTVRLMPPETEIAALETVEQLPIQTFAIAAADEAPPLPTKSAIERSASGTGTRSNAADTAQRDKMMSRRSAKRGLLKQFAAGDRRSRAGEGNGIAGGLAEPVIWGVGPTAYDAPRGASAADTFARNFF